MRKELEDLIVAYGNAMAEWSSYTWDSRQGEKARETANMLLTQIREKLAAIPESRVTQFSEEPVKSLNRGKLTESPVVVQPRKRKR